MEFFIIMIAWFIISHILAELGPLVIAGLGAAIRFLFLAQWMAIRVTSSGGSPPNALSKAVKGSTRQAQSPREQVVPIRPATRPGTSAASGSCGQVRATSP